MSCETHRKSLGNGLKLNWPTSRPASVSFRSVNNPPDEMEPPTVKMQPWFNLSAMVDLRLSVRGHTQAFEQFQKFCWIRRVTNGHKVFARVTRACFRRT